MFKTYVVKLTITLYSIDVAALVHLNHLQKNTLKCHHVLFNEPCTELEAARISEVDHGLGERECKAKDMSLLLSIPEKIITQPPKSLIKSVIPLDRVLYIRCYY